ncbi:MAG: hypothetical protein JWO81_63 [Alphaproteobacteria bacterium]|nr:hypothetical protein [Alphaproteobacteria bacterium]
MVKVPDIREKAPVRPGQARRLGSRDVQAIPAFAPGDLVTTEQLNRLVDALKALDRRLAELERRR